MCYHPPTYRYYCTVDVTFREGESYFGPCRGETSSNSDRTIDSPLPIVASPHIPPPLALCSPTTASVPTTYIPPILYTYSRRPRTAEQVHTVVVPPMSVPVSAPDSDDELHVPLARLKVRSRRRIFISQRKYTLDLLEETGMLGCAPADTPIEANHKVDADTSGEKIHARSHHSPLAGSVSGIEIPQEVSRTWASVMQTNLWKLKCLQMPIWPTVKDDRKSTTGYFSFVGGNLVSWKSKKHNVVARSNAEAEYRAMTQGVCERLWLKTILQDMSLHVNTPFTIYCDNKAAISIAHNPFQHDRTKHIEVDRHFIKDHLVIVRVSVQFPWSHNLPSSCNLSISSCNLSISSCRLSSSSRRLSSSSRRLSSSLRRLSSSNNPQPALACSNTKAFGGHLAGWAITHLVIPFSTFSERICAVELSSHCIYASTTTSDDIADKNNIVLTKDTKSGEVCLLGATVVEIRDIDQFLEVLQIGEGNRHAANTKMNARSSRSHAILVVHIQRSLKAKDENDFLAVDMNKAEESSHNIKSKLLIIDLAGSERIDESDGLLSLVRRILGVLPPSAVVGFPPCFIDLAVGSHLPVFPRSSLPVAVCPVQLPASYSHGMIARFAGDCPVFPRSSLPVTVCLVQLCPSYSRAVSPRCAVWFFAFLCSPRSHPTKLSAHSLLPTAPLLLPPVLFSLAVSLLLSLYSRPHSLRPSLAADVLALLSAGVFSSKPLPALLCYPPASPSLAATNLALLSAGLFFSKSLSTSLYYLMASPLAAADPFLLVASLLSSSRCGFQVACLLLLFASLPDSIRQVSLPLAAMDSTIASSLPAHVDVPSPEVRDELRITTISLSGKHNFVE
ncbi:Armadillo repeat-containing kinesin-like protein 1 [Platanthera zijinensis]|uniref:Kinesin-like protein n=1 Tax=Platanthera zijinensis TaxID=2320716 RepID=A0AAP0BFP1_9ASPA